MANEMFLIILILFILVGIVCGVLLIFFWMKSSYRKKDTKIKELQNEIEELRGKN
ncbi:lipopolysaccharide assembly protein LapA domain-containing protein [Anaerobacillus arseniciselenatis]|uniref:lipopolysaccharide assembly protein LapA domain-containing protein n=1 Tax=Anaerobacillus arseniciselenatis TaxID=85682 RepID=UPI001471923D|nr:lipopolysaccharide assembly protein LapA domain-containing protein [Anaerobacillus arseniciselenatis]